MSGERGLLTVVGNGNLGPPWWLKWLKKKKKNPPAMQETRVRSLGWEDPLEKGIHSSILAWRIPWTEQPGRPQSMGTILHFKKKKQKRKWKPCWLRFISECRLSCVFSALLGKPEESTEGALR